MFRDPKGSGRLVSEGTRKLAALSFAKLLPTNIKLISPSSALLQRLGETPLFRHPPGPPVRYPKLPSPILPINLSPKDDNRVNKVSYNITIPEYENA